MDEHTSLVVELRNLAYSISGGDVAPQMRKALNQAADLIEYLRAEKEQNLDTISEQHEALDEWGYGSIYYREYGAKMLALEASLREANFEIGKLDGLADTVNRLGSRLTAAEMVCKEAQWVLQDPSLTSSSCSSSPWEQPVDSRVALETALKSWLVAKGEVE